MLNLRVYALLNALMQVFWSSSFAYALSIEVSVRIS